VHRPVVGHYLAPRQFRVPEYHRRVRMGTNGTLEIGEGGIQFVSDKPADSRTWLYPRYRDDRKTGSLPLPTDDKPGDLCCGAEIRASGSSVRVCMEQGLQPGKEQPMNHIA
jgi:hypothetical protein